MAGHCVQRALCSLPLTLMKEVMFGKKYSWAFIVGECVDVSVVFLQVVTVCMPKDRGFLELLLIIKSSCSFVLLLDEKYSKSAGGKRSGLRESEKTSIAILPQNKGNSWATTLPSMLF